MDTDHVLQCIHDATLEETRSKLLVATDGMLPATSVLHADGTYKDQADICRTARGYLNRRSSSAPAEKRHEGDTTRWNEYRNVVLGAKWTTINKAVAGMSERDAMVYEGAMLPCRLSESKYRAVVACVRSSNDLPGFFAEVMRSVALKSFRFRAHHVLRWDGRPRESVHEVIWSMCHYPQDPQQLRRYLLLIAGLIALSYTAWKYGDNIAGYVKAQRDKVASYVTRGKIPQSFRESSLHMLGLPYDSPGPVQDLKNAVNPEALTKIAPRFTKLSQIRIYYLTHVESTITDWVAYCKSKGISSREMCIGASYLRGVVKHFLRDAMMNLWQDRPLLKKAVQQMLGAHDMASTGTTSKGVEPFIRKYNLENVSDDDPAWEKLCHASMRTNPTVNRTVATMVALGM